MHNGADPEWVGGAGVQSEPELCFWPSMKESSNLPMNREAEWRVSLLLSRDFSKLRYIDARRLSKIMYGWIF